MTDPAVPAQQAPPPAARFIALRSRDFRLLLAGQAISLTGSQMQQVAVVWQLYLLSGSPLALGMLGFFRIVPIIVFALGGGVVADALDRRRLMLFPMLVRQFRLPQGGLSKARRFLVSSHLSSNLPPPSGHRLFYRVSVGAAAIFSRRREQTTITSTSL